VSEIVAGKKIPIHTGTHMTNHARIGFGSGSKISKNNKTIKALKMSEESKKISVYGMYRNKTTKRKIA
jgi:hypothetical protein